MTQLADWILANADAISGYVVLLGAAVAFTWALGTGRLYLGRNLDRLIADKDQQLAACQAELREWQFSPRGEPPAAPVIPPPPPSTSGDAPGPGVG